MTLETKRKILWDYLLLMVEQGDLHGVRDACVDIEKIDVLIQETKDVQGNKER
jgi:hypothetical protein